MIESIALYFSFVLLFIMIYIRESGETSEIILVSIFCTLGIITLSVSGANTLFIIISIVILIFNIKTVLVRTIESREST